MKKKKLRYVGVITILSTLLAICGCKSDTETAKTLGELAYDENKKHGYTVYLKEDTVYVPYLVLTSDYNGHVLLLREELLEENHVFNEDGYGYAGYYKDSSIDRFLNEEFIALLEEEIQEAIVESEIMITAKESIGRAGEETENIVRKVFLLSYAELGFTLFGPIIKEGESLKYFENPENRIAYKKDNATGWLLRSPEVCWFNVVGGINAEGGCGAAVANKEYAVRPAFCMNNNLAVEQRDDVYDGKTIYVIAERVGSRQST